MADRVSECCVTSAWGPDSATLVVEGELTATTTDLLEGAVLACLRVNPHTVAVDLARVDFMDAAGIAALLDCRSRAAMQQARLVVIHPNRTLTHLMRPEVRALLAVPPTADRAGRRELPCIACGAITEHVPGPTTRGADGEVLVQWWSCTACDEGNTVVD